MRGEFPAEEMTVTSARPSVTSLHRPRSQLLTFPPLREALLAHVRWTRPSCVRASRGVLTEYTLQVHSAHSTVAELHRAEQRCLMLTPSPSSFSSSSSFSCYLRCRQAGHHSLPSPQLQRPHQRRAM